MPSKSKEVSPRKSASKKKLKKDDKLKSSKKDSSSKKKSKDKGSSKKGDKKSSKKGKDDKKSSKKKKRRDDSSESDSGSDSSSEVDSASVDEISCGIESYTREQFIDLRNWNKYACGLHFFQSFLQLVLGVTTPGIKDFALPIKIFFLEEKTATDGSKYLDTGANTLGVMTFPPFVAMFLLLSAIFHYIAMSGHYQPHYRRWINRGKNYFRWIEYSISSTFMIWVVAQLAGCYDIGTLLLISAANITMNLLGLLQEMFNNVRDLNREINWISFNLGVFIGMTPWFIILVYAGASPALPGYVVALMIPTMLFFQSFPVNMYLQYARIGQWKEYIFGEKYYIFMSLLSKSCLAWLVFLNLQQENVHNGTAV